MPQSSKKSSLFEGLRAGGLNRRLYIMAGTAIVMSVVVLIAGIVCLTRGQYGYALMNFAVMAFVGFAGVRLWRDVKHHS
ncbi:hypothetical protein [Lacticaseibacillus zhaodongensis]|uniref:hypothetical protein n=1 Tax=Lacticaseibacillus zhaodongensis TaxID=2668065 RepID=UPI0012D34780|nr:hypothetical protein [Lacticaseibacillus zhaodongensis]